MFFQKLAAGREPAGPLQDTSGPLSNPHTVVSGHSAVAACVRALRTEPGRFKVEWSSLLVPHGAAPLPRRRPGRAITKKMVALASQWRRRPLPAGFVAARDECTVRAGPRAAASGRANRRFNFDFFRRSKSGGRSAEQDRRRLFLFLGAEAAPRWQRTGRCGARSALLRVLPEVACRARDRRWPDRNSAAPRRRRSSKAAVCATTRTRARCPRSRRTPRSRRSSRAPSSARTRTSRSTGRPSCSPADASRPTTFLRSASFRADRASGRGSSELGVEGCPRRRAPGDPRARRRARPHARLLDRALARENGPRPRHRRPDRGL